MEKEAETLANSATESDSEHAKSRQDGENVEEETVNEIRSLPKVRFIALSAALVLGLFVPALDESIVGTAIPHLTQEFGSLVDIGWYGSAYFTTSASFQFLFGQLYTHYSTKWVYLTATVIFEIGSLLCALSRSSPMFIVGRAIAGIGTAGSISGVINIVAQTVAMEHRAAYLGTLGSITMFAAMAAPVLGGVFSDSYLTWRWCFWINLPIGGFVFAVVLLLMPRPSTKPRETTLLKHLQSLDLGGIALVILTIISFLIGIQWAGSSYSWSSAAVLVPLILSPFIGMAFVLYERWMGPQAAMPMHIICSRNVAFGVIYTCLLDAGFYTTVYYLPIWFQAIKGQSAQDSGVSILACTIATGLSFLAAGIAVSYVRQYYPFMVASAVLSSVGAGLFTTLSASSTAGNFIPYQIIFGIGIGLGTQLPIVAIQAVLKEEDVPRGIAVIMYFQVIGPAVFIAVAQAIFSNRLQAGLPGTETITETGALNVVSSPEALQVYNTALDAVFYLIMALVIGSSVGAFGMERKRLGDDKKDEDVESQEMKEKADDGK